MSSPKNKITIIVPVLNMGDKISECLTAIFNQSYKPYEVIVVDGHSRDNTVDNAQKFQVQILYENYGTRAGANQIGLQEAKGDYIAFTDADCIPDKDWLKNLINEFETDIVGVGGSVHNIGNSLWQRSINLSQNTFLGAANSIQGRVYESKRYVTSISGCNCLYRKKDLIRVGGFKTDLCTAEDTEVNNRLLKYGKLLYLPNAIVIHKHGRGLLDFSKRMRQYGSGRVHSQVFNLQALPPVFAAIFISLLFLNRIFAYYMLLIYISLVVFSSVKIVADNKNPLYIVTIPITYLVEHISYTYGFWAGIIHKVRSLLLTNV